MRVHIIPTWIPVPFEPAKKPVKPRKFFHTEETDGSGVAVEYLGPKSTDMDEEAEEKHTDVLA
jgi:hypothetical protein